MRSALSRLRLCSLGCFVVIAGAARAQCVASPAPLQQATATYSQACGGNWSIANLIDGNPGTGWAIYESNCGSSEFTFNQTAVFEAASDIVSQTAGQPPVLELSIFSGGQNTHTLGLFRLSVTSDDRSTFADGLSVGGDVSANWVALAPDTLIATVTDSNGTALAGNSALLTVQPDGSILASGPNPEYTRYTIRAVSPLQVVTGLRLEVIDANGTSSASALGLPTGGPGRAINGNFILREMRLGTLPCESICSGPADATVCPSGTAGFSVTPAGIGPFTYQWQWQQAGSSVWNVLTNGSNADSGRTLRFLATGATDQSLSVTRGNLPQGLLSVIQAVRCIVTNTCGDMTSNSATLTVCPSDFNCDGSIDFFDYLDFVSAFSSQSASADFNQDLVVDFFDYLDFVQAFSGGC